MLISFLIFFYSFIQKLYIVLKIISKTYKENGQIKFKYPLSQKFKLSLEDLMNIIMNINAYKYTIRINNKINQAVILFPC